MGAKFILIGPPGSGKSSTGRFIARTLNVEFADTDSLIEKDQKKTVGQIFVEDGEPYFREVEERICLKAINEINGVVSLGGGSVLSPVIQKALEETAAHVIFLDVSLSVAAPRIGFNRDRPLLLGNPRQQWQKLMDARRPIYEKLATIKIETGDQTVSEVAKQIISELQKR
ncbi:MAG: shikimate kinase [Actinomycetota bacterium]